MNQDRAQLIEKFWDDSISEAELLQLKTFLSEEPEMLQTMAEELHTKGLLLAAGNTDADCSEMADKVGMIIGAKPLSKDQEDQIIAHITQAQKLQTTRPTKQKSKVLVFALAAAACVAFFAGVFLFNDSAEQPQVIAYLSEHAPHATIQRGQESIETTLGQALLSGDHVSTGSNDTLQLHYAAESSTLILQAGAAISLTSSNDAKHVQLHHGTLLCDIAQQSSQAPLTIQTRHAEVTVLGTQFSLTSDKEQTRILMSEGEVSFRALDSPEEQRVTTGESASVDTAGTLTHALGGLSFNENEGELVVKATHFHDIKTQDPSYTWQRTDSQTIVLAPPSAPTQPDSAKVQWDGGEGPTLTYRVHFSTPGQYHIWVQSRTDTKHPNAIFTSINGQWQENATISGVSPAGSQWQWAEAIYSGHLLDAWKWERLKNVSQSMLNGGKRQPLDRATLTIPHAGIHTLQLSVREPGVELGRIILKRDSTYLPEGNGPPESPIRF